MNGSFLTLQISDEDIKLAFITQGNGRPAVSGLRHMEPSPAGEETHARIIRRALEEGTANTRRAFLVIGSEDLIYKDFSFPFSSPRKVMDAIRFETSSQFPPDEYVVDHVEITSAEPGRKAFLAAIARKEVLRQRIQDAEDAGLKIIGITSDLSSLGHYFIDDHEALVMEVGLRQTLFVLYSHRVPLVVRHISIGLRDLEARPGRPRQEGLKPLVSEIKRTILSFNAKTGFDLDTVHMSGSMVEREDILRALGETADFRFIHEPPATGDYTIRDEVKALNLYASLLGTAGWRKKGKVFDFLRDELVRPDAATPGRTYLRWGLLTLAALLCAVFLSSWLKIIALQQRDAFLAAETRRVFSSSFPQVTRIVDEVKQARSLVEARRSEIGAGNSSTRISVLGVVDAMSRILPKDVNFEVVNLFWERGRLEMDGRTDSFKKVNQIQELLSKSESFPGVTISNARMRSDGQDVEFKITIRLAG